MNTSPYFPQDYPPTTMIPLNPNPITDPEPEPEVFIPTGEQAARLRDRCMELAAVLKPVAVADFITDAERIYHWIVTGEFKQNESAGSLTL